MHRAIFTGLCAHHHWKKGMVVLETEAPGETLLLDEWNRIQPRGENYCWGTAPIVTGTDSWTMSSRYNDIRLPPLNLHITKEIIDFAIPILFSGIHNMVCSVYLCIPNRLNFDEQPFYFASTRPIWEHYWKISWVEVESEYKGYHTPFVLGEP